MNFLVIIKWRTKSRLLIKNLRIKLNSQITFQIILNPRDAPYMVPEIKTEDMNFFKELLTFSHKYEQSKDGIIRIRKSKDYGGKYNQLIVSLPNGSTEEFSFHKCIKNIHKWTKGELTLSHKLEKSHHFCVSWHVSLSLSWVLWG